MKLELFKLPYEANALEPVISKQTIDFHYGKHAQAYVNNLNKLIEGSAFEKDSLVEIIKKAEGGIFNNAAQSWNHEFYFLSFSPKGGGAPTGDLAKAIEHAFGNFDTFKEKFVAASTGLFGSGWAWLAKNSKGELNITQESNAGNPLKSGLTPLLCFDVWEHAYYLDYQNRRPDHINELWKIVDWKAIEARFKE